MKLPRTTHIEGSRLESGQLDPDSITFDKLSNKFLVIEEKVDGTGVSISLDSHLDLQINHRGSPAIGKEFKALHTWADKHWEDLLFLLSERYILFGEWMYHKHTIFYDNLPHFFLESDIYDQERNIWLSTSARNNLLKGHTYIKQVPVIAAFKPSALWQITDLVGKTKFQSDQWQNALKEKCSLMGANFETVLKETDSSGMMEGLYIKHEDDFQVKGRYKYVRHEFLQSITNSGTHLIDRQFVNNMLMADKFSFDAGE
jgi:hypothetical protein